jgi:hypothetical protein
LPARATDPSDRLHMAAGSDTAWASVPGATSCTEAGHRTPPRPAPPRVFKTLIRRPLLWDEVVGIYAY